jgi:glycosyltransferase involved in cell wall biosynthesis
MLLRLLSSDTNSFCEHRVISLTGLDEIGLRLQSIGITVDAMGVSKPWHIPSAMIRLSCLIRRQRPDVVQTWMYHADLIGGLAARLAGCRNVVWNVRTNALPRSAFKLRTRLLQRLCAAVSYVIPRRIIVASRAGLNTHVAIGYSKHRMLTIGNGFAIPTQEGLEAARPRLREEWGLAHEVCAIGMVGRFDIQKGQDNFIRAAGLLARSHPAVHFIIIGRQCDPANALLSKWVQQAGLQGRIHLLGERYDVTDCLAALDVFCLPSLVEGFPNALGEAMAAGRACVTTAVGGAEELMNAHGIVVPAGNSTALANAMACLATMSPAERETLGQTARLRIVKTYGLDRVKHCYTQLYIEISGCLSWLPSRPQEED